VAVFAHVSARAGDTPTAFVTNLLDHGAKAPALVLDLGEGYRLLTSHFVHTSWTHLGFNLALLFPVGAALEQVVGRRRYAALLLACGLSANLASLALTPGVSAGASGLVFGLLGAAITFGLRYGPRLPPRVRVHFGLFPLPFAALTLALGLFDPRIDVASHVAGLAGGLLAGAVLAPVGWPLGVLPHPPALVARRPLTACAFPAGVAAAVAVAWALAARGSRPPALPVGTVGQVNVPARFQVGFGPLGTYRAEAAGGLLAVETDALPPGASLAGWYATQRLAPIARAEGARVTAVWRAGDTLRIRFVRGGVRFVRTVDVVAAGGHRGLVVVEAPAHWRRAHRETRRRVLGSFRGDEAAAPFESPRAAATLR